jgi:uncharacterized protein YyaL (SSP411 family)
MMLDQNEWHLYEVYDAKTRTRKNIGTLDTYAYFIQSLYYDYQFNPNTIKLDSLSNLDLIKKLIKSVYEQFWDINDGGFYLSSNLRKDLLTRIKSGTDMPIPDPNAVMLENILQLYYYTGEESYLNRAETGLQLNANASTKNPTFYGAQLIATQWYLYGSTDIAIIIKNVSEIPKHGLFLLDYYIPRIHIQISDDKNILLPLFKEKQVLNDKTTYYFKCSPPTNEFTQFTEVLNSNFSKIT